MLYCMQMQVISAKLNVYIFYVNSTTISNLKVKLGCSYGWLLLPEHYKNATAACTTAQRSSQSEADSDLAKAITVI